MNGVFLFSQTWVVSESPLADGGKYTVHDSQAPSLSLEGENSPSSPTEHDWEMNYQEAAIYLQVSISRAAPGPSCHVLVETGSQALLDACPEIQFWLWCSVCDLLIS